MDTMPVPWLTAAASGTLTVIILLVHLSYRRRHGHQSVNYSMDHEMWGNSRELLQSISRQLNALDRIGERVEGLDRAFRIPRVRGGFGETLLEELLGSWLPAGSWATQYSFSSGSRVDAVIKMGKRLVAVDSKFPLEQLENWLTEEEASGEGLSSNVRKAFLNHAQAISSKYIRPDEGTLGFALMYLPAENIHYRLLSDDNGTVMRECLNLRVLPVGPLSLFAYLQTVSYGLKGLALPAEGEELRARVDCLRRNFNALLKPLSTAAVHLKNLNGSWQEIERMAVRMESSLDALESQDKK